MISEKTTGKTSQGRISGPVFLLGYNCIHSLPSTYDGGLPSGLEADCQNRVYPTQRNKKITEGNGKSLHISSTKEREVERECKDSK
jgi:hypothetical protein